MTRTSSKIGFTRGVSFPIKIVTVYFMLGVLWVLFSDKVLGILLLDPKVLTNVFIVKGCFYVSVTALMLYVLISRGVSQIEQSEKEARLSDAKYRELVESANSIIMRRDITGHITFFNEFAQDFFGYSKDEILGRNVIGTIVPEVDRSGRDLKEMIEDIGKHPERYTSNENENMRANGERVWIAWTNKPIRDEHGRVTEILCVGNDITERKQAEKTLMDSETRLRAITDSARDAILMMDPEGMITYWNQAAERILGYTREEADGQNLHRLIAPQRYHAAHHGAFLKFVETGRGEATGKTLELVARRKDGEEIPVELSLSAIFMNGWHSVGLLRDITERKMAEAALAESEQRFSLAMEATKDGLWDWNLLTDEVYYSPGYLAMLGYAVGEVPSEVSTWADRIHPEDKDAALKANIDCIENRRHDFEVEFRMQAKNGEWRWIMGRGSAAGRDEKGQAIRMVGTHTDITERKRVQDELFNSRQMLRSVLDNIPQRVFWKDRNSAFVGFNKPFVLDCGYEDPSELVGKNSYETPSATIADVYDADDREVMESGRPKINYEEPQIRADGTHAWLMTSKVPMYDQDGQVIGVLGTYSDITERKLMEEALRESEAQFRTLVESAPQAIFIQNQGHFAYVNRETLRLFGAKSQELLLGESVIKRFHPDHHAEVLERIRLLIEEKKPVPLLKEKILKLDGTAIDVEVNAVPFRYGEESGALFFASEITDRMRAEGERKILEEQLFQAHKMESVGRLAGGVAHDFNNMLGVIIGRAEVALDQVGKTDPHYENLQEILKAAHRSADLTRQLLAFARKQTAIPKILDLNDTISSMLKMLRRLIGEDIDLHWAPGPDVWKIKIDPSQVDQILANLVVNARDAISGVGAITMRTGNIAIADSTPADHLEFIPGDYVQLTVSDTGEGMSQEVRENIFEPFFTTKELGEGTGLGLSTVYGIVKQNDGFIYVASELGKGTTFNIYLPRFATETAQIPSEEATGQRPTGTETILLVEDDEAILNLSKMILEKLSYTVLAAHTPLHAIHLVEEHPSEIHLLITDVVMPQMNGRELAEQLIATRPNLKCLYMSGYTADLITHRGILDEGVNFIQKPFGTNDLAAKVRRVLDHLE